VDVTDVNDDEGFDIVPTKLAIEAMRDNGYRNAAYALAELIDNAVEAGAKSVEVLCSEQEIQLERLRRHIHQIAVLDNGSGMDATVLRKALQFGNGTHLSERKGMGRFGMGLPSASISQCRRVDVWSWQHGADGALHTYVDLEDVTAGRQREIPAPTREPVPPKWRTAGNSFAHSGTLVVWSKIDRCVWRMASAIFKHSEFVVGRMYRRFLQDGNLTIRMAAFLDDAPGTATIDNQAVLNDPLYLMVPSSCPEPYKDVPMFMAYGADWEITKQIAFKGETHPVVIRLTYAKEEARKGHNPGEKPYGKHAKNNVGVSIVRADRELELSQAWVDPSDPRERWWGVEIDFPPALDELFGVSNNKQTARNLAEVAKIDFEELMEEGHTVAELKAEYMASSEPIGPLLDVSQEVQKYIRHIRRLLKAQTRGAGKIRKDDERSPERHATDVTNKRKEEGYYGASDAGEALPSDERERQIEQDLVDVGMTKESAKELAAKTVDDGLKYVFAEADFDAAAFFTVKYTGGAILISLNVSHPAYRHLIEVLEDVPEQATADDLRERLENSRDGLKLLLTAWARYEDEQPNDRRRVVVQDARAEWGRYAREYMAIDE
jgi:hypothetical protein